MNASSFGLSSRWSIPVGARDQLVALLPDQERVLGPDHPSVLTTRNNLASATGGAGDPVGARDQFAALLPDQERVLGPDHPRRAHDAQQPRLGNGRCRRPGGRARPVRRATARPGARARPPPPRVLTTTRAGDPVGARNPRLARPPPPRRAHGRQRAVPATRQARATGPRHCCPTGNTCSATTTPTCSRPATTSPRGRARPGTQRARATRSPRCCLTLNACSAPTIPARSRPVTTSQGGRAKPATRQAPATSSPRCCPTGNACSAPTTPTCSRHATTSQGGSAGPATSRHATTSQGGSAGPAAGARERSAALLLDRERVLGHDHPDVLTTRNNLWYWNERAP